MVKKRIQSEFIVAPAYSFVGKLQDVFGNGRDNEYIYIANIFFSEIMQVPPQR